MIGLGLQEILLLCVLFALPVAVGAIVLATMKANRKKRELEDDED